MHIPESSAHRVVYLCYVVYIPHVNSLMIDYSRSVLRSHYILLTQILCVFCQLFGVIVEAFKSFSKEDSENSIHICIGSVYCLTNYFDGTLNCFKFLQFLCSNKSDFGSL